MTAHTIQNPKSRVGQPDEVAARVVWLCSEQVSFVTGVTLPIDRGGTRDSSRRAFADRARR
jgi:NAD(P)-dependent dehydrogenase (short-subunit alcohol dehydrogenase family)